jgi:DNA-binding response OmpR family regulator
MAFHIVVIDDDPALQEFYTLLLENEGYRVTIPPLFDPSSTSIVELHPDLIILDLLIGGQQRGWSFLQAFINDPQTATLPILLVTALPATTFETKWKEFIQRQNISIIMKPFDIEKLLNTIRSFLPTPEPPPTESAYNDTGL